MSQSHTTEQPTVRLGSDKKTAATRQQEHNLEKQSSHSDCKTINNYFKLDGTLRAAP